MAFLWIAGALVIWMLLFGTAKGGASTVSSSVQVPPRVMKWASLAEKYAQVNAILDPEEILAIAWSESSGNPLAMNANDPSWGLMGVTQLIAHAYGRFDVADISWHTDADKNMKAGAGFLADLKSKYSADYPNWVAAYNEGETNLLRG